jgi:hypothetical protein
MKGFICGCLCRRRVAPVLDANFSKPIHAFYSLFFILYFFFLKKLIRGHYPGVVTNGDNVTHKYTKMRRLAHDETPFLLAMQPRVTILAC